MLHHLSVLSVLPGVARGAAVMLSLLVLALSAGCGSSDPSKPSGKTTLTSNAGAPGTAKEALQRLAQAYREAVTYADQGVGRIQYKLNGELIQEEFPFSVTYAQPNRLWLKAYAGEIVCDGQQISGIHESVRGYVRTGDAPAKLTIAKAYGNDYLTALLAEGPLGGPLQLDFLLNEDFVENLTSGASQQELLEPATAGGERCHRAKFVFPPGDMVFWIGQRTGLLHRVEYPHNSLQQMLQQQGQVAEMSVVAEFTNAKLNEPLSEDAFVPVFPEGAKKVKQFIGPAPAEMMGKPAEFAFKSLDDGTDIKAETLHGKVAVLDFWATWCEHCPKELPHAAKAYGKYKDNDKVRFLAVSIDGHTAVPDEQVKAKLKELKVDLPLARPDPDPNHNGFGTFQITAVPTRLLLGPDGTVQFGFTGQAPDGVDPVKELSAKIDALLEGKDLYAEMISNFEAEMMKPPPEIPEDGDASTAMPEVKIAEKSQPKSVKLVSHWDAGDVNSPGNLFVVDSPDGPKVFVIEAYRAVAQINPADGKVVGERHDLGIPETAAVAYVRSAADGQGRRYFAASAVGQGQVFVFDEQWKRVGQYPKEPDSGGIGDTQFVDLDGDGKLELAVGFLSDKGVSVISLQGESRWEYSQLSDVISLAASPADESGHRKLYCVHPGGVTVLDHQGKSGKPLEVEGQHLRWLFAATGGSGQPDYAGFGYVAPEPPSTQVTDALLGVDLAGKARWTYALPTGQQPWLEQLACGRLAGEQPHWIVAAADGSMHFVSTDGKSLDRFNVGTALTGFAAVQIDGKRLLLIATAEGLKAWRAE